MIDEHTLDVLEFEKVKRIIASHTTSVIGREGIEKLVPSDDIEAIRRELRLASEFSDAISFDGPVPITGIKDIRKCLDKCQVEGSSLFPNDFLNLRDTLKVTRLLRGYFSKRRGEKYPFLSSIAQRLAPHPDLEEMIDQTVDPKGEIKDSASSKLARIRRDIEQTRASLRKKLEAILNRLPEGVVQDRVITLRDNRYVIPIRGGQQSRLKGIIHDQSASGATLFVEPLATLEMSNHIQQLEIAQKREIDRILRELTDGVREIRESLWENVRLLGRFDSIYAKASYALETGSTEPLLNQEGRTIIRSGRHPLLAHLLGRDSVVPLEMKLGEDFLTLVITGPNAGGKTVALKTVGLLTLMAQSGLHIPADEQSEIGVFGKIFADIGDEQSIEEDLSTFSSHIRQLTKICLGSDEKTLVLLDEIGSGTNPEEGVALAISILRSLTSRGTRTIVTTHHGALKLFAHQEDKVENGSMEFDSESLEPTFKFRLGIPGSSYAFEIAERLGMPEEIVADATGNMGEDSRKMEGLINDLKRSLETYEQESRRLQATRTQLEELTSTYQEKLKNVKEETRQLKREALEQARGTVKEANALVERTVAEIRSKKASTEAIKQAKRDLRESMIQIEGQLESLTKPETKEAIQVEIGDRVWIESLGREGEVLTREDSSGRVQVQVGSTKVKVPSSQLQRVKEEKEVHAPVSAGLVSSPAVSDRIDLRGMTFDEAWVAVDKYLDDVFLAGLNTVRIIHGKGTGALREKIGRFLKDHPRVKSQRLGAWNEGGSGVTVVEIKDE